MPNDVPLQASTSHTKAEHIHTQATPGDLTADDSNEVLADRSMLDSMVRRPTEEDFDDVLTPEGNNSGDIVGSDVSGGVGLSNDSLGGI